MQTTDAPRVLEDGAVRVPAHLASAVFAATMLYLADQTRASGGALAPDARQLLQALHQAANGHPGFAPETPSTPADTVMLGMGAVAALLGCTPQYARRLARSGRLPAQRVGHVWLISPADLDAYRYGRQEDTDGEPGPDEQG
ncbi:hypothetical protein SSP531S_24640 [Streptomyces spongiicola]|uniref:Helix-turn-helix domain-containing protein n=1 Tax=Streptomyces spongiicola TaxID=1690221 RepID=A0A388SYC7_9ACTN|nr:helix-turn-helix domain-containing protein [Streptomyces spongiicola]GBQ01034.1 hypothetical protein SSP531S_24640 [Streptomyces spongiicola]